MAVSADTAETAAAAAILNKPLFDLVFVFISMHSFVLCNVVFLYIIYHSQDFVTIFNIHPCVAYTTKTSSDVKNFIDNGGEM